MKTGGTSGDDNDGSDAGAGDAGGTDSPTRAPRCTAAAINSRMWCAWAGVSMTTGPAGAAGEGDSEATSIGCSDVSAAESALSDVDCGSSEGTGDLILTAGGISKSLGGAFTSATGSW